MQGNTFAHLVLLLWLPFSLVLASMMSPLRAFLVIALGGALLLPENLFFDFPLVPPFDKHAISMGSALIAVYLTNSQAISRPHATKGALYALIFISLSTICTVWTNRDPLHYGPTIIPGLSTHDIFSGIVQESMYLVLPFYLGQALIRTTDDIREFLRALVIAGLAYAPLILLEARLSPILHTKLYGYFQHEFLQAMRDGGFRAFVFMSHGLSVAFFISQSLTAAFGLQRLNLIKLPLPAKACSLILTITLISCKSMGAFIYTIIGAPLVWFTSARTQLRVASWLAIFVYSYPLARMFDFISTDWFLEQARYFSEHRASSLAFRFQNEGELLAKAQERLYFGWGGWGRSFVFDPETGWATSVVDGEWIIQMGTGGALRFLTVFGILLLPIFAARKAAALLPPKSDEARCLALMAILLALTGLDSIPNSLSHKLQFVIAGALAGVSASILKLRHHNPSSHDAGALDRPQTLLPPLRTG